VEEENHLAAAGALIEVVEPESSHRPIVWREGETGQLGEPIVGGP
jgi:hypothetical protein